MAAYIDHASFLTDNLDWYLSFFKEVYDMTPNRVRDEVPGKRQVWLTGGVQLNECAAPAPVGGKCDHLCLVVDDLEGARDQAISKFGCKALPKHHWIETPDGLQIEMFPAADGAVEALRNLVKKA